MESSVFFETREAWRSWLLNNHSSVNECWLEYFKKHTGKRSIVYREALEEAICFGWIDGIVKTIDEERYMQRFTPRRKGSNWSETNIRLALRLQSEGRMHSSGMQYSKFWIEVPGKKEERFTEEKSTGIEEEIRKNPEAYSTFSSLSPSCKNQYVRWISAAKRPETRNKRISESISLLEKGKKLGLK
jgi:uncharacterized protein YdeI (YjbR/CyaY-like superfamily)